MIIKARFKQINNKQKVINCERRVVRNNIKQLVVKDFGKHYTY